MSHAHGWSTGPTSALTNFVAGIDILERAGARWGFNPQFGDLSFAEAGVVTPLGTYYRSRWSPKLTGGGSTASTTSGSTRPAGQRRHPAAAAALRARA